MTTSTPVICFGQQPSGIFPKRYLVAKILTARRLQKEIGGEIVFFYHDADHDPRETKMILHHRKTGEIAHLNFEFENKWQRKFSPLHLKRVMPDWVSKTTRTLPNYVDRPLIEAFQKVQAANVAEFCLEMYRQMGLIEGIRIARSSDPEFRKAACEIDDFFVDVPYCDEVVRARHINGALKLHEGGDTYIDLRQTAFAKEQISPTRDSRLRWMQSVVRCTHYVSGASEQDYLRKEDAPEIIYVKRDMIERSDEAYTELSI